MNYKISYYLLRYGGLISIILLFIATQLEEGTKRTVLAAIGFMSLGLNIVQSLAFYQCPGCGHVLPTNTNLPKYCPECDKKLN